MIPPPRAQDEASHRRRALGLGAAATLVYLLTAPAIPNLDGLGYLKLIPYNFAAGHLLYMPVLRALAHLMGDGLRAGRLYDALLGGTGVVLVYSIARRLFAGRDDVEVQRAATIAAAGVAVSWGYWSEANDVEAYAAATVALLATVRMALSFAPHPTAGRALATGLLLGLAVLSHLTHVLLSLFVAHYLFVHAPRGRRLLLPALALASGGALSLGAYAYAAFVVRGHDLRGAIAWVETAQHGFVSQGGPYRLADAVFGLAKTLVFAPYLYESNSQKLIGQFLLGLVPLTALVVGLLRSRRALFGLDLGALAWWSAPYALLGLLFFGSDSERWIFILPAGWIVAAAFLVAAERPLRASLLLLAWIAGFNLVTAIWPAHSDNWPRQRAEAVAGLLHDGDLVIFPGHSWDEYVVFYGKARVEAFPLSYYAARDGVAACWARLDRELALARARGGHVYVLRVFNGGDTDDGDTRGFWELSTTGLSRPELQHELGKRGVAATLHPIDGLDVTRLDPPPGT